MTTHHHPLSPRPTVPLAIWPVAQTTAQWQRAGRYLPDCARHPGKMLPELARRIVTEYSDPRRTSSSTPWPASAPPLVEAALLDRRALGVELEARWADLADENLDHMLAGKQRRRPRSATATPASSARSSATSAGKVDLVVTSPPYACDAGVIDKPAWLAGGRLCPSDDPQLLDRPGQPRPRPRRRLRRGHGRDLRRLPRRAPPRRATRRGDQEHPARGRMLDLAGLTVVLATEPGSPTSATSSRSTRRSATATSPPALVLAGHPGPPRPPPRRARPSGGPRGRHRRSSAPRPRRPPDAH